jgi:lysophospholipase L1-like esterase
MNGGRASTIWKASLVVTLFAALVGCASFTADKIARIKPLVAGDRYVAMGSSFAAGPGVTFSADQPANRCARSNDNYARQLARSLSLSLVDVSCSGATTAHVLGPWKELPAQIDALSAETRLVTVTIGGNDVSLVRNLIAFGCQLPIVPSAAPKDPRCPTINIPTDADWQAMEAGLDAIALAVKQRAPNARLAFVQYVPLLPESKGCAAIPFSLKDMDAARQIADRLATVTLTAAKRSGSLVINARADGRLHDPCSNEPWATGFPKQNDAEFVPFHPNLAGMSAIANTLHQELSR